MLRAAAYFCLILPVCNAVLKKGTARLVRYGLELPRIEQLEDQAARGRWLSFTGPPCRVLFEKSERARSPARSTDAGAIGISFVPRCYGLCGSQK